LETIELARRLGVKIAADRFHSSPVAEVPVPLLGVKRTSDEATAWVGPTKGLPFSSSRPAEGRWAIHSIALSAAVCTKSLYFAQKSPPLVELYVQSGGAESVAGGIRHVGCIDIARLFQVLWSVPTIYTSSWLMMLERQDFCLFLARERKREIF
jgi:hypothetical protein